MTFPQPKRRPKAESPESSAVDCEMVARLLHDCANRLHTAGLAAQLIRAQPAHAAVHRQLTDALARACDCVSAMRREVGNTGSGGGPSRQNDAKPRSAS